MDVSDVRNSRERGCLDFIVSEQSFYVGHPSRLFFEHISSAPINSFFLLELGTLEPSGVYDETERGSEELIDVNEEYLEREVWDRGYLGHDENGDEIPLPEHSMLVVRFFRGKMLIVSKGSIWNGIPATYDGRHDNMTPRQIREFIEMRL